MCDDIVKKDAGIVLLKGRFNDGQITIEADEKIVLAVVFLRSMKILR